MPMAEPFTRRWDAAEPKGVIALVHGLAEHSGRYEHVGTAFTAAGYTVRAVDIRGHGHSEGWPGKVSGAADWHEDTAYAIKRAREAAPGRPVFLLGHSLGSLIVASFVAQRPDPLDGLVLSGYAGLPGTAMIEAMSNPDGPSVPAELICRDPEIVKAYVDDPLVFFENVPIECNASALEAAIGANTGAATITVPVLMAHGSADAICDVQGAREFHDA